MAPLLTPLFRHTTLLPGEMTARRDRAMRYLLSLSSDNLLMPYRHEAGLFATVHRLEACHWGWDGPLSDLRGTFTGHWLSAAARLIDQTGDEALWRKACGIVREIAHCQTENGGEWAFPIPEKHLHWLRRGKQTWAPQYVCHKTMMGLLDMYRYAGSQQALHVLQGASLWFDRFSAEIPRALMDEMMDQQETGGMMELWADLYAVTGDPRHLALMRRYERPRLFEPLLRGEDVLTNMHANTTIPEIHGAARAYEVTGEERYRRIVEAYWAQAVTLRGQFVTGGQTCGELWTPPGRQAARLGAYNQEHCVVYNMMRLADYLLRWQGDAAYADYWERNLLNGVLAQTFWQEERNPHICCADPTPDEGLVAYYLGLSAGSRKGWGTATDTFWCCYGTGVQANAALTDGIFYRDAEGVRIEQFQPAALRTVINGMDIRLEMTMDTRTGENIRITPVQRKTPARPEAVMLRIRLECGAADGFTLRIRRPWWLAGEAAFAVEGTPRAAILEDGHFVLRGPWSGAQTIHCTLPKGLTAWPLADAPDMVAFLDGPVALAGLCEAETRLYGDPQRPETLLVPDEERRWQTWYPFWRTRNQPSGIRFVPLHTIGREAYTVYFPVVPGDG